MNKLSQVLYFDLWYYMQLGSLTTVCHFQCLVNIIWGNVSLIFKDLMITCVQKLWETLFTVSNTPSVLHFSQTGDFLNESAAGYVDPALLCFSLQLVPVATADMASCTLPRRWSQSATEAERQTVSWLERERECVYERIWLRVVKGLIGKEREWTKDFVRTCYVVWGQKAEMDLNWKKETERGTLKGCGKWASQSSNNAHNDCIFVHHLADPLWQKWLYRAIYRRWWS